MPTIYCKTEECDSLGRYMTLDTARNVAQFILDTLTLPRNAKHR